jgi:hypothetical protein
VAKWTQTKIIIFRNVDLNQGVEKRNGITPSQWSAGARKLFLFFSFLFFSFLFCLTFTEDEDFFKPVGDCGANLR